MRNRAPWLVSLTALTGASILAQGAAVPISEEHHHHLMIQNSYVNAYAVELPAHEQTLLHQHDYDYVYVVIGDADVTNAVVGNPVVKLHLADTTVNFSRGPFAHVAGNAGDSPFRNVTISLLHPQGEVKTYYPSVNAAMDAARKQKTSTDKTSTDVLTVPLLETNEVRVDAVVFSRGTTWASTSERDRLIVILNKSSMLVEPADKKNTKFPSGEMHWVPAGKSWSVRNKAPRDAKAVVLEFKDSTVQPFSGRPR